MARHQSHFTFSTFLAIGYAVGGVLAFRIHPEFALLASVVVVVAGLLPNIDNGPGAGPAKEFIGFIAALAPLLIIENFPGLKAGGIARISLVVICSYLLTRIIFSRIVFKFTANRGMIHSIPAAIICFELVYILFWDLLWRDRLYVATAALVGFLGHLFLDATTNIEITGAEGKKPPVMKLFGKTWTETTILYSTALVLGWFVARDIYPQLSLYGGIRY